MCQGIAIFQHPSLYATSKHTNSQTSASQIMLQTTAESGIFPHDGFSSTQLYFRACSSALSWLLSFATDSSWRIHIESRYSASHDLDVSIYSLSCKTFSSCLMKYALPNPWIFSWVLQWNRSFAARTSREVNDVYNAAMSASKHSVLPS